MSNLQSLYEACVQTFVDAILDPGRKVNRDCDCQAFIDERLNSYANIALLAKKSGLDDVLELWHEHLEETNEFTDYEKLEILSFVEHIPGFSLCEKCKFIELNLTIFEDIAMKVSIDVLISLYNENIVQGSKSASIKILYNIVIEKIKGLSDDQFLAFYEKYRMDKKWSPVSHLEYVGQETDLYEGEMHQFMELMTEKLQMTTGIY